MVTTTFKIGGGGAGAPAAPPSRLRAAAAAQLPYPSQPSLLQLSTAQLATSVAPLDRNFPAIVTLYKPSLSMECEVNQATRRCLSYCPIYGA